MIDPARRWSDCRRHDGDSLRTKLGNETFHKKTVVACLVTPADAGRVRQELRMLPGP